MPDLTATVSSRGQVTIPKYVRDLLNIQKGDELVVKEWSEDKNELTLKLASDSLLLDELQGSLKSDKPYRSLDQIRQSAGRKYGKRYDLGNNS